MTKPPFLASILMFAALASANAQVTQVTSGGTWNTGSTWSDGVAAGAGKDYLVPSNMVLRPPFSGGANFPGDSLTINGQFNLTMAAGTTNTITVSDLRVNNGGAIVNANGASAQTLAGNVLFDGPAFFRLNPNDDVARPIIVSATISGDGAVGVMQKGSVTLTGTGNTFSGTWTVGGTNVSILGVDYSNTINRISTLVASSEGSLGIHSDVVLNLWSRLDLDYDWTTSGSLTLADNGAAPTAIIMTLDTSVTVGALTVADFSFAAGTYDYDDFLNAGFGDYFTDSGGMITVIPEPHTVSLLLPLGLGVMLWLRRRRRAVSSTVG